MVNPFLNSFSKGSIWAWPSSSPTRGLPLSDASKEHPTTDLICKQWACLVADHQAVKIRDLDCCLARQACYRAVKIRDLDCCLAKQACLDKQPNKHVVIAHLISSTPLRSLCTWLQIQALLDGGTFSCAPVDGGQQLRGDDAPPGGGRWRSDVTLSPALDLTSSFHSATVPVVIWE